MTASNMGNNAISVQKPLYVASSSALSATVVSKASTNNNNSGGGAVGGVGGGGGAVYVSLAPVLSIEETRLSVDLTNENKNKNKNKKKIKKDKKDKNDKTLENVRTRIRRETMAGEQSYHLRLLYSDVTFQELSKYPCDVDWTLYSKIKKHYWEQYYSITDRIKHPPMDYTDVDICCESWVFFIYFFFF